MAPIPLPSHIHYELLLQLLERQTLPAIDHQTQHHHQTQELISTLRKALSQQKQLETELERTHHPIEHHWSLNNNA
jgi:hypothetical protein